MLHSKKIPTILLFVLTFTLSACQSGYTVSADIDSPKASSNVSTIDEASYVEAKSKNEEKTQEEEKLELTKALKTRGNTNPITTQAFGADPFVMVYEDTAYIYMTADTIEYDADGSVKENTYSKIQSIHCVSTKDMKNFTDHGEIHVAGPDGAAKWAHNSWAPAAAHKTIDGKEKFFLYFADNGGGIGVLSADSPIGPFIDPIGEALISRNVPTCDKVLWLFDPAVLVDDDGTGYIYFGGGVPEGKADFPGTGRVCKLGLDMISLDGDPVQIDVPYLFEDSGIHKFGNKYYYTYCTNWTVPKEATSEYGFSVGEIACMVSDSPMGPFTYQNKILENPGKLCGLYGNNHHAIFSMNDKWYIAYHSRMLEKNMGLEKGYRVTFIDEVKIKDDGSIGIISQSKEGPDQLMYVDPYKTNSAVCVSNMAGTNAVKNPLDKDNLSLVLGEIEDGDYVEITGVDFSSTKAKNINFTVIAGEKATGKIHVRVDYVNRDDICLLSLNDLNANSENLISGVITSDLTDVHFLYFVFEGSDYTVKDWSFNQ